MLDALEIGTNQNDTSAQAQRIKTGTFSSEQLLYFIVN